MKIIEVIKRRPRVLITGSDGTVGQALQKELGDLWQITPFDLTHGADATNLNQLRSVLEQPHDAIINAAWNTQTDNWQSGYLDPLNTAIALNVMIAANERTVPAVVLLSSVHAVGYYASWQEGDPRVKPEDERPYPDDMYGHHKRLIEGIGRVYAEHKNTRVLALRLGGVNPDNLPTANPVLPAKVLKRLTAEGKTASQATFHERVRHTWLAHQDLARLMNLFLNYPEMMGAFAVMFATSDNNKRFCELDNPWGWRPEYGLDE